MTIKDRILSYLKEQGISREDFYRATGLSASNFKGAALNSELGGEKIAKILSTYRDVSPDWLLLDDGPMLRSNQVQPTSQPATRVESPVETAAYYNMYKEEKAENKALIEEIGGLKERIRALEITTSADVTNKSPDKTGNLQKITILPVNLAKKEKMSEL